ncbi:phospholipase A2 inhibitor and Ly6/PLAUR domain-containing protein-like [Podarcis raffonei]|uniref:phospholipase A2 inhibitor and Ly6/PLAUR domain-containing protein-like n=1 Tax=Podarcis raffonei TaxID=65483 RepID=UPI0023293AA1|nr:phospholipase A2 inhibitor and Ly6/PLAUR domain-containing protein-like [Podarcis raffonei]XP_053254113.1 phospholipase A2 inhibitor and Ly6/PLAUR domain-containing protein-like [Podarcis raffonei]XP_053254114.1 phospholipase A2 inhibitor and Ly6/PLAUR domain-containing protein-like [Podarcis raffonei]XP_053254115.1 phospholipase A2 inhibitor and Ly6/PLAUR domain-containing protein-like [Podarcis raffonei]XP_053254116.1 phospholipase A2 inhibitor and Ly6/PLAUR domain-containing protein-like 
MQALLGIFFFSLLTTGASLDCVVCRGQTFCTGKKEPCPSADDVCYITLAERPKDNTTVTKVVKGCLSPDLCKIWFEIDLGQDKHIRESTVCCSKENCSPDSPELPRMPPDVNGKFCPSCYSKNDVCPEEYVYCTGGNAFCIGFITVTDTNVVNSTMKGCISESGCQTLQSMNRSLSAFPNMRNVTCSQAKVSQASRAAPSLAYPLLVLLLMKLLL